MVTSDSFILLFLLIGSFWTRLWLQAEPDEVVFDEFYFGNFTSEYLQGRYFFDIHPPLGKLLMTFFAWLAQYDPIFCFETHFSKPYDNEEYLTMRLIPELSSALCIPCLYVSMRLMSFSIPASITAAGLSLFETSLITEGRFILTDGILHFLVCFHLVILLLTLRKKSPIRWLFLCGLSLGAACSCKNTAWGMLAVNAVFHICDCLQLYGFSLKVFLNISVRGFTIGFSAFLVYIVSFIVHFVITPYDGPGVDFLTDPTTGTFLINPNDLWAIRLQEPHILIRVFQLVWDMHGANMGISVFHAFESRPVTWPLLTGSFTAFWSDGKDQPRKVNCNGNVYVYVMVFYAIIVLSWCAPVNSNSGHFLILFGYYVSYLPFFLIHRAMFLYHYHIPLFFGCMAVGAVQDLLFHQKFKIPVTVGVVYAAFKGFQTWYPFVYGISSMESKSLIWDARWILGDEVHKRLAEADALNSANPTLDEI
jgi:dolichyl-phosphate-mannose--protein O-mannosyl transferase